jgi:Predicted ornithine cyclodeaminase, mu-crystallin homolog
VQPTRIFTRSDVERLLDYKSCITAVAEAFRQRGIGRPPQSALLGVHVPGGGFHAKAATLELSRPYFVVKTNANFPKNPSVNGLPTIQGVLVLFDATNGVPLAVMDSMAITTIRTAAASAVAADFLARKNARTATFVGSGVQARAHLSAMSAVRKLERVSVFDLDERKAAKFADEMRPLHPFEIVVATGLGAATRVSDIVVTATSSSKAFLGADQISPGTFIAAVGADNEHKQEIEPELLRASVVIADDLEQCATIGDLHHAIEAGILTRDDVRATLDQIAAGTKRGRLRDDEIIIFDSTGIAIEDVAAAAIVFERGVAEGAGLEVALGR